VAQSKVYRIGVLIWWPEDPRMAEQLREAFREAGLVDGRNVTLEFRWAAGSVERATALAAELVRMNVDVLVVRTTPAIKAAQDATRTIPIVMMSADPVGVGVVATLARPGGNVTGVSQNSVALSAKRLDLIRAILPRATRVAYLASAAVGSQGPRFVEQSRAAAPKLGLQLEPVVFVRSVNKLEGALATIARTRPDALIVQPLFTFDEDGARRIADIARRHRLPTISDSDVFAELGGLIAFGASVRDSYRRLALYVDKILKGAKPADLPVQEPTNFELIINLKTAKAIGVTIPPSVLLRADRVIE
jgi:putative ABC transport system substrate-binding protein